MKRQLFTIGGAALFVMICLSGNAPAQTTPPSEEIVGDRQEIRQDRDAHYEGLEQTQRSGHGHYAVVSRQP